MKPACPTLLALLLLCPLLAPAAFAQTPEPGETEAESETSNVITVDREAGLIDLAAKMVPAEPQWLELIATTPGPKGREHEAIVTIEAKPSHIHLALVTLGLEAGHPLTNKLVDDKIVSEPPEGPEVELFFVYEADGKTREVPVYEWVIQQESGEPLPACRWLFTGSTFRKWQDREYYMADEAGNIASLVNFGDDLIVRKTETTQDTDFQQLQINKQAVPPYGSDLVLRIKVAKPAAEADQPADAVAPQSTPESPEKGGSSDKPAPDEP